MSLGSGRVVGFPYEVIEDTAQRLAGIVSIDQIRQQRSLLVSNLKKDVQSLPELINSGLGGLDDRDRADVARRISDLIGQLQSDLERLQNISAMSDESR